MKFLFHFLLALCSLPCCCLLAESPEPTATSSPITVSHYCQFLNATAATDFGSFYNEKITSNTRTACIIRKGIPGAYQYDVIDQPDTPILFLSWNDSARYCEWENFSDASSCSLQPLASRLFCDPELKSNLLTFRLTDKKAHESMIAETAMIGEEGIITDGLIGLAIFFGWEEARGSATDHSASLGHEDFKATAEPNYNERFNHEQPENGEEKLYLEKADIFYSQTKSALTSFARGNGDTSEIIDQRMKELIEAEKNVSEAHQRALVRANQKVAERNRDEERAKANQTLHRLHITVATEKRAQKIVTESQRAFQEAHQAFTAHSYYKKYSHPLYHCMRNWRNPRPGFLECYNLFQASDKAEMTKNEAELVYQQQKASLQLAQVSSDDAMRLAEETDSARIERLINEDLARKDAYGTLTRAINKLHYLFSDYQNLIFPWCVKELQAAIAEQRPSRIEKAIQHYYPPRDGFLGEFQWRFVMPGEKIVRYGTLGGRFLAPITSEAEDLAIPPAHVRAQTPKFFEVLKPFPSVYGTVAPAFGQRGLGKQMVLPSGIDVQSLLNAGHLREISSSNSSL